LRDVVLEHAERTDGPGGARRRKNTKATSAAVMAPPSMNPALSAM
jgi:hypothetical protein